MSNFEAMAKTNWPVNKKFDLGTKSFSEEEIIRYAKEFDPLPFHLNRKAAESSRFKGLVCSGGQAFYHFYVNAWVPLFGQSIEAGLGITEWKFLAPIYENETIKATCHLLSSRLTKDPFYCINRWEFSFNLADETEKQVQYLLLDVMHKNSYKHE